jgi:DNA-binding GntR family transcriptional regulator
VRQALRDLQHEGLVTGSHRSMLRVSSLSSDEVRELFRVRAALEGLAVSQVISRADRKAAAEALRGALAHLVDPHADFVARVDADLGFHLLLCQLSNNSVLVETWRYLEGRLRVVLVAAGPVRAQLAMSRERHEAIIDSIESGSPEAAASVVNQHLALAADELAVRSRLP